jgi:hypothetical protein
MKNIWKYALMGLMTLALLVLVPPSAFSDDQGGGGGGGEGGGGGGGVEMQAVLVGTDIQPDATGLATFRARSTTRGLEVTVDAVDLTDTVWVLVNGDIVAQITIIATRGGGGIETRRGDDVPDIQPGDLIEIADADGNVLLWGVF